jgi:pimeloyl-ACP methyl ester carboxylesterase
MGGKLAQYLASDRPAGLLGLVLVAPSPPRPLPLDAPQAVAHAISRFVDDLTPRLQSA